MNWFKEDIGKAIDESKKKQLIFMVYCFDSNSEDMTKLWNIKRIYTTCNENCVCLSLEADSEICNQFKQIYAVNLFPTTHFIGLNGQSLEIIEGIQNEDELFEKIQKSIQAHNLSKSLSTSPKASTSSASASNENVSQKTLDERVAMAKQKLKQIQEKKMQEEEEKQRNSEMERRKMGQEILKSKKDREEQELKRIADEKRKEKMEDQLAKQKIIERIQQDREDKQKRYAKEKEEQDRSKDAEKRKQEEIRQQQKLIEASKNSEICRIQFRFVDGSSLSNQFDPNQKLKEIRDFVAQKLKETSGTQAFTIHSSFPKREYTSNDMESTLRDLQLAPTSTLLIIPVKSQVSKKLNSYLPNTNINAPTVSTSSIVTYTKDILSFVFLPITIIWGIIGSLIGIGNNQQSRNDNNQASFDNQRAQRYNKPNISKDKKNNDDDDNATWNGNSTQQL